MSSEPASSEPASSEPAIRISGLSKAYAIYRRPEDRLKQMLFGRWRRYYDEYWALRDLTLDVHRGETIGVVGRNGSGKSTLLQLVCGTLAPTAGTIATNGRIAALLELGAGFHPDFTGRENVFLSASVHGLSEAEIRARIEAIEDFAGIGDFIDQPVKLYSSGMYARLAFAVAAHVDAEILIIDEILAVGDAVFTQKCMRFIRRFKEHGTIFFVSHDTAGVRNLCDRAVWLNRGNVRGIGPADQICDEYVAALYEEEDDGTGFKIGGSRRAKERVVKAKDERIESLARDGYRNKMEVFSFDPDSKWFGQRGATIDRVAILLADDGGAELRGELHGGDEIVVAIEGTVEVDIDRPIVGFFVKDRLGQALFGDNTFLSYREDPVRLPAGGRFQGRFRFVLPYLPTGHYSICAAIADGTQVEHVQHHWIDDAVIFSVDSSHVVKGLVGLPMLDISLVSAPALQQKLAE
ncbi:MAG: ABC transporter ATP-binding protein [Planctomycetes bacterium]|nr:ABC transporter ATP-binding protein [Planctomycetota bacterium]